VQNRYVGDLGDFGKYGLLRTLCGSTPSAHQFSLGVVWYLVPDEDRTNDGSRTQYLSLSSQYATVFRSCDPELYDALGNIVTSGKRNVQSIRESRILPPRTAFFEEPLTYEGLARHQERRLAHRLQWLERGYEAMASCDVVFLDPDNGLEGPVAPYQKTGPKYVFLSEAKKYSERGQSLIIYQHLGRRGSTREQLDRKFTKLLALRPGGSVFAMLYHRGTARAFFVLESRAHKALLFQLATKFLCGPWSRHFELVRPSGTF